MTTDLDEYLDAIAAGDKRAFGKWLAGAEPVIRNSLRSFASVIDVESVIQETFLRAWQIAPDFRRDGRSNSLLRYAIVIAYRLAVTEARRIRPTSFDDDELDRALAVAERGHAEPDPILRRAIADCLDKLSGQPRLAFDARLTSAGGQDDHVLAAALGMQLNTFLQNFGRARRALAKCLEQRGVTITLEVEP